MQAELRLDDSEQSISRILEKYAPRTKQSHLPTKLLSKQIELWKQYVGHKIATGIKEKTVRDTYNVIERYISLCPHQSLKQHQKAYKWYLGNCKGKQARRVFMHLSAAHKWGLKQGLVEANPWDGLYRDLPKPDYEIEDQARPLSPSELTAIHEALEHAPHSRYKDLVLFMLYTGCRPSEAIGLRLRDIKHDHIRFCRAITQSGGRLIYSDSTKTKRDRIFPVSGKLSDLLSNLASNSEQTDSDALLLNQAGKPISYNNFSRRCWSKIAPADTTPYSLRDTFITQQLIAGYSATVVANWVGNSTQTIERSYMGRAQLAALKPAY